MPAARARVADRVRGSERQDDRNLLVRAAVPPKALQVPCWWRPVMAFGDYPVSVVATAVALPPLMMLAAAHLTLTASFGPCSHRAAGVERGDARVSAATAVLLLLGFVSAGCAVLEEMVELGSREQDFLRCFRDVFLVAAGHACYPLAVLVAQTTVWRRKTVVSRCMRAAGSALSRCLFSALVAITFVVSALACVAWPFVSPWKIGPAPPLRTAALTAPGIAVFIVSLLLAGCNGSTPWGEGMAVLLGAICALGGTTNALLVIHCSLSVCHGTLLSASILSVVYRSVCSLPRKRIRLRVSLSNVKLTTSVVCTFSLRQCSACNNGSAMGTAKRPRAFAAC